MGSAVARALPVPVRRMVPARTLTVVVALTLLAFALLVIAVGTGDYPIAPVDVVKTLLGQGDGATEFIVETLRLPRALTGILAGAALGAAGAIFQSIARNPLGSPDIIGFTAGSSAAAVFEITVIGGGTLAVAGGSIVGGLLTAFLVYGLAFRDGVQGYRLVLVGIGISAMLEALVNYLLTRAKIEDVQAASVWLAGSLNGRGWEHVWPTLAGLAVLLPACALLQRDLKMVEMGDDTAKALGANLNRTRALAMLSATVLCGAATAACGPIVFVGLMVPHIVRSFTGPDLRWILPYATILSPVLLLGSDVIGRLVARPAELQVGIVTALIGGPVFIFLVRRRRTAQL
jgi:iron complex transport system permease protein